MSTAQKIEELLAETVGITEEEFLECYPFPFLLREATKGSSPEAVPGDRKTMRLGNTGTAPIGDGFAQGDVWFHAVCPKDVENNDGAVRLGRDETCDIVVGEGSISGVHAQFTLDHEGDERVFMVADVGSANGTFVNGEKIEASSPVRLDDQDSVRFGPAVKFQFFRPEGFWQFLEFYRRIKK